MKTLIPHKETYYVVYDNFTSQFVGPKDNFRREYTWPDEVEQAKKFDKKSDTTKVIKILNKAFLDHGTPPHEIDFRACKVQVKYVRTVAILNQKKK